jgi:hypothetical protein
MQGLFGEWESTSHKCELSPRILFQTFPAMEPFSGLCPQGSSVLDGWTTQRPLPSHGEWGCTGLHCPTPVARGSLWGLGAGCPTAQETGDLDLAWHSPSLVFTKAEFSSQCGEAEADK